MYEQHDKIFCKPLHSFIQIECVFVLLNIYFTVNEWLCLSQNPLTICILLLVVIYFIYLFYTVRCSLDRLKGSPWKKCFLVPDRKWLQGMDSWLIEHRDASSDEAFEERWNGMKYKFSLRMKFQMKNMKYNECRSNEDDVLRNRLSTRLKTITIHVSCTVNVHNLFNGLWLIMLHCLSACIRTSIIWLVYTIAICLRWPDHKLNVTKQK